MRDEILAILCIGHGRPAGEEALTRIYARIDAITLGSDAGKYYPHLDVTKRDQLRCALRNMLEEAPVIESSEMARIQGEVQEVISLMEIVATRNFHGGILFEGEKFIGSLGLDVVETNITAKHLWSVIENAIGRIVEYFGLASGAVYVTPHGDHDYSSLTQVVRIPTSKAAPKEIGFASFEQFERLSNIEGILIPNPNEDISWLHPHEFFEARHAFVFLKSVHTGHLILVGLGCADPNKTNSFQIAILLEAVRQKIFRFAEEGLFAITLDNIMAEMGHLMGRVAGKITSGFATLQSYPDAKMAHSSPSPKIKQLLSNAEWALEDGICRLEIISHNFYSFGQRRQGGEIEIGEQFVEFDAIECLRQLESFFRQSVKHSQLSDVKMIYECDTARVRGNRNSLKLIFLNLFDNAHKFAYADTYLEISASQRLGRCVVSFSNLGIGIASGEEDRIFNPFYKSRYQDPSRRIEGLGLGLSFCRWATNEVFHGSIDISSRKARIPHPRRFDGDNYLTTVSVSLPTYPLDPNHA
ncbi:MAG: sensor histidine kinase [Ignavibacteriae bacterium]|nr:sensor histidine kinase [Ignavibacteriota bacterium]